MRKITYLLLCLFLGIGLVSAQTRRVTGVVISADDAQPVIGASVVVKGATGTGTVTNLDGRFELNVPSNATHLVVSYIGMVAQEVAISQTMRVVLLSDTQQLDEVVVTALGISREKKALGYAVSEVKGDEMIKARGGLSNPVNALQGKVAGLKIAGSTGLMGGSSKIQIRGANSISGNNQPLFVIDGVPIEGTDFNSTETARGGSGYDYGNLVQDINPDDIENISVLKGANASALYGSRAANGVVMITTKKGGRASGYGVSFSTSVGFEKVNKLPKLQKLYGGGYDFEEVEINGKTYQYPDYATDESWGPKFEGQDVLSWYDLAKWEAGGKVGNPTTSKWMTPKHDYNEFFETGVSFTNNIAISQATDRASLRVSYTNSDLKGYMPNSSLKKNIFNISGSNKSADQRLELFTTLTYLNQNAKGRPETGYGDNNVMVKFVQWGHRELDMVQSKEMYLMPDGTQATWNRNGWDDPTPAYSNNPYWSRYMCYQNDTRHRVYGNVGVSFLILPELKAQFKSNLDFFVYKAYERNAVYSQELSRYMEMSRQQYELNNEFMLMYNKNFDNFTLGVNLGGNMMDRRYEYVYGETQQGLAIPLFYNLKNSVTPAFSYNLLRLRRINSVYGNFDLGWKSMLYIDGSIRNDWSSTLPKGNNSYLYPAITGSFIFSEMTKESLPWLSFGKLRLGYAMVGNDTDPYQVIDTYSQYTKIASDTGTGGYTLSTTLKNPDLKSEKINSFEAGLELNFFNNRLGIEATVYSTESKNQIIPLSVTGTTGYLYRVINSGLITNKGIEIVLNTVPVKTPDFTWTSTVNFASNRNKVVELTEGTNYYRLAAAPFMVEIGALKGAPYGTIMGTDFIYDDKGSKVVDDNGVYLSTSGNVNLGKIFPDFSGGWLNSFRYRNLDLSVLLDFSKGGHYFSTSYMWGMYSGMLEESAANNVREDGKILEGVKKDGSRNDVAIDAETWGAYYYAPGPAAQSVFKSDYLKLREINIGYTIPMKRGAFLQSLRVSAYGRNLAVWGPDTKHFDPEMIISNSGNIQGVEGGAIPSVANYGLNISVNF